MPEKTIEVVCPVAIEESEFAGVVRATQRDVRGAGVDSFLTISGR